MRNSRPRRIRLLLVAFLTCLLAALAGAQELVRAWTLPDLSGVPNAQVVYLTDVDTGKKMYARTLPSYGFDAGEAVGSKMLGAYGEIAYEILQHLLPASEKTLEPFFRYEYVDTQFDVPNGFVADETQENHIYTVGFSFKPIPNVVVKMDYRNRDADDGDIADEFNIGIGYAF